MAAWSGKRGGLRVIYHWAATEATFLMLYIYSKSEQGDLTPEQVKVLGRLADVRAVRSKLKLSQMFCPPCGCR